MCSALKRIEGRFEPDYDDFAKKAADPKVKMLMLCNPHNPTGTVWTEEELRKIGEIAEKNDLWIVSDEIHCDLLRSGLRHTPMANAMPKYEKLITCMSASKTFNLAGMLHSNIIIRNREERRRFVSRDKNIGSANPLSLAAHKAAYSQGIQVNDAVDSVRREERKEDPSLADTRYLWLKNPHNLTERQKERLGELSLRKHNRKTARIWSSEPLSS